MPHLEYFDFHDQDRANAFLSLSTLLKPSLWQTGYCPECNDWFVKAGGLDSPPPTKPPSPAGPTEPPVTFRSWANDSWMDGIKRRDSSARETALSILGFVLSLAVVCVGHIII